MKRTLIALAAATCVTVASVPAMAADKIVGVSWKVFQEERWKRDEAVIKKIVEDAGNKYISADAQGSAGKQLTDVESLIAQGADVLMIVPFDSEAILPAVEQAAAEGIPMIAYDVQIEPVSYTHLTLPTILLV